MVIMNENDEKQRREPIEALLPSGIDLDDETVGMELIDDVDRAFASVSIRMANGVRACLGHGQLQIAENLLGERTEVRKAAQGEADQRDVLGLRRNRQLDGADTAVRAR